MTIEIWEKHKSRPGTHDAENPKLDIVLHVAGTDDEFAMDAAVDAFAPTTWGPNAELNRQGWDWTQPENKDHWEVTVHYDGRDPKTTGIQSIAFDNAGGTQHITQSKRTLRKGNPAFGAQQTPDNQGTIGVTDTGIEGVDVAFPKPEVTVEALALASRLSETFTAQLNDAVGKVNDSEVTIFFHGQEITFDIGEMLFTGFNSSYRGNGTWSFTFKFAISKNTQNIYVGGTTDAQGLVSGGIDMGFKYGWDYLWVRYHEIRSNNQLVRVAKAAYIEQVYEDADFNELIFDRSDW